MGKKDQPEEEEEEEEGREEEEKTGGVECRRYVVNIETTIKLFYFTT